MKLLDLFSGIGGFSLAFKRIFPDGEIIGFSEIDKYAVQIYQQHFPGVKNFGSVTDISTRDLPKFNIVTFGFPCQDLSIAGKRNGFEGKRSSLFFEAIRIINEKQPEYFIFENVKGLYSSHEGKDFTTVLRTIADIGYDGQWQLLNTKWFLPQNRERIYFVGHLRGESRPEIFPIGENCFENERVVEMESQNKIANCLNSSYAKNQNQSTYLEQVGNIDTKGHNSIWGRVYNPNGLAATLNGEAGGLGAKTGLYQITTAQPRCGNPKKGGTGELSSNEYCFTIDSQPHIVNKIRRLTSVECERLQGFPDGWTEYGINDKNEEVKISDTQRYKTLGNAITVNVAQEIFRRLKLAI